MYSEVEESSSAEGVMGERKGFRKDIRRAFVIQTTDTQISCQSKDCLAKHHGVIAIVYWQNSCQSLWSPCRTEQTQFCVFKKKRKINIVLN